MNDMGLMIGRSLRTALRRPVAMIAIIATGLLFLLIYPAALSGVSRLRGYHGDFLGFVLPVSILSAAISGAGYAGQALARDIKSGYFSRLLLTPTRRLALVWGPVVVGALLVVAQTLLILLVACLIGLRPATGFLGVAALVGFAFLWGVAFAGYTVVVALLSQSPAATQVATFAFFPLIFLSSTFVPREPIAVGWLKTAAALNPTTYVLEAMQALLLEGWQWRPLLMGLLVVLGLAVLTGSLALRAARHAARSMHL